MEKMTRHEIRIAGYGGQGVITLSKLLINAAITFDRHQATQAEAYGPASRGGSCWAEVVIEDNPEEVIDYPRTINPEYYVLLSDAAAAAYRSFCNQENVVSIIDPLTVKKFKIRKGIKYEVEAQRIATEEFKLPVIANVILFGALVSLTKLVSVEAGRKTVEKSVPSKVLDLNLRAYERGLEIAKDLLAKQA
ncbi:MAG: 2-oxoacid:ferredoxin oxidoreductase subunit gamma [Candidatus Lokiarchaeota archaeon]|nr:2-oxoacid:ferredoxin oxidoreductase subunit gamma [Candidatus Lokiarchaeota archaeon]